MDECMDSPASPFGPDDLKHQAARLREMAVYVFDRQLAERLEGEAAQLLARAEAMISPQGKARL
jgi:hypothetical protein